MAGRASVWSSSGVRALARRFVPCADEVWRLQSGTDAESLFFRDMANQGHYGGKKGTRQGIYVSSPSGKLLASINSLDSDAVEATLKRGLARWERLPAEERRLAPGTDVSAGHRWEASRPAGGLVLVSVNRDLPQSLDPADAPALKWNRDHAWLTRDEAAGLVPRSASVGARQEWPSPIVARFARFHLVDNVVGQTLPFADEEVRGSAISSEVVDVDGARVTLRITGETNAVADGRWRMGDNDWKPAVPWPRGIRTRLDGLAEYDLEQGAFTSFELVAQGVRWGRTQFNGRRGRSARPSPIGFVFTLASDGADSVVAPAFVDIYADWIIRPSSG